MLEMRWQRAEAVLVIGRVSLSLQHQLYKSVSGTCGSLSAVLTTEEKG
jgi:hypothetical protein